MSLGVIEVLAIIAALRELIIVIGPWILKNPWTWDAGEAMRGIIAIIEDPVIKATLERELPGCRVLEFLQANGNADAIALADAATGLHRDIKRTIYIVNTIAQQRQERLAREARLALENND